MLVHQQPANELFFAKRFLQICCFLREGSWQNKFLKAGGVPANKFLKAGWVPANKFLKAGGVPANKFLKAGEVPANKFLKAGGVPANNLFLHKYYHYQYKLVLTFT
jgi:hypothetical protein